MPDVFKPTDEELISLAAEFNKFAKANGIPVAGVVSAQVIDFPLVGPAPYTYDPTMYITFRDSANGLYSYDLQLMLVSGNAARDLMMDELRRAFQVNEPRVIWQNFVNPPEKPTDPVPVLTLVGDEIPGQPGFFHPTTAAEWSTPNGVRYKDPLGRGWFVWVASLFDRKWQKLA